VSQIVGITKNSALLRFINKPVQWVEELADLTVEQQREFEQFHHTAGTWKGCHKVIAKLEVINRCICCRTIN
jgi:hypothetical protein